MAVTGHTVMSDSACRASALGASVVASATASATRALLNPPTYVLVYSTADLPAAVAGVITLAANTTYVITTTVDLAGARLVCSANTAIIGGSSENCRIKSTGLGASPLITSAYSLPMRNVSIEATIALALDATGNPDQALDWTGGGTVVPIGDLPAAERAVRALLSARPDMARASARVRERFDIDVSARGHAAAFLA